MLLKAIVISMAEDTYQVYVTIPVLDGSSSKTDFRNVNKRLATICTVPGCNPLYSTGDVVYVDFEKEDEQYPVVLGMLYRAEKSDSTSDMKVQSLKVLVNTDLSDDVSIGDLNYELLSQGGTVIVEGSGTSADAKYDGKVATLVYKGEVS